MLRAQLEQARIDAALGTSQRGEWTARRDAATQTGEQQTGGTAPLPALPAPPSGAAAPAHSAPRHAWETPTPPRMRHGAARGSDPEATCSLAAAPSAGHAPTVGVSSSSSSPSPSAAARPQPAAPAARCAETGAPTPGGARPVVGSRGVFEAAGRSTPSTGAGAAADCDEGLSEGESEAAFRMRLPGEGRSEALPAPAVVTPAPAAAPADSGRGDRHLLEHYTSLFGSSGTQPAVSTTAPAPAPGPGRCPDVPSVAIPRSLLEDAAFGSFAAEGGGATWLSAEGSDDGGSDGGDSAAWGDAVRAVEARYLGDAAAAGSEQ